MIMDVIYGHAAAVHTFGHRQKMHMDGYFFHWLIWRCEERKESCCGSDRPNTNAMLEATTRGMIKGDILYRTK